MGFDRARELWELVAAALVPPRCAACGRWCEARTLLCGRCARRLAGAAPLAGAGPAGVDRAWSAAAHEGVARDLVVALKFHRLLPVAGLMADRIRWLAPASLLGGAIVPVPPAPRRLRRRGFDPAAELARALALRFDAPLRPCLARRGGGRQVGKRRGQRLGSPPEIVAPHPAPRSALLVDDVMTTGATLTACARALRGAGSARVVAVTFTRRM